MPLEEIKVKEREAQQLLSEHAYQEAAEAFSAAGQLYHRIRQHQNSALCLASAASCSTLQMGEKTFHHAAKMYEQAAEEAQLANDLEYAAILYKHSAICYERDLEYLGFSECFFRAKEFSRKFLFRSLFLPRNYYRDKGVEPQNDLKTLGPRFLKWLTLTISAALWGHGERPHRTILFGLFVIVFCAFCYHQGLVNNQGVIGHPSFPEALYFSVVTFTTVGYGDIVAVGLIRGIVMCEALSGLFIVPLFLTGLCRKYLRF
jgi:hypothetical protein